MSEGPAAMTGAASTAPVAAFQLTKTNGLSCSATNQLTMSGRVIMCNALGFLIQWQLCAGLHSRELPVLFYLLNVTQLLISHLARRPAHK